MATTSKKDKVLIADGDNVVELSGQELELFEADRKEMHDKALLLEAEQVKKAKAREDAIKKLAEIAGLTDEEIAAII